MDYFRCIFQHVSDTAINAKVNSSCNTDTVVLVISSNMKNKDIIMKITILFEQLKSCSYFLSNFPIIIIVVVVEVVIIITLVLLFIAIYIQLKQLLFLSFINNKPFEPFLR